MLQICSSTAPGQNCDSHFWLVLVSILSDMFLIRFSSNSLGEKGEIRVILSYFSFMDWVSILSHVAQKVEWLCTNQGVGSSIYQVSLGKTLNSKALFMAQAWQLFHHPCVNVKERMKLGVASEVGSNILLLLSYLLGSIVALLLLIHEHTSCLAYSLLS